MEKYHTHLKMEVNGKYAWDKFWRVPILWFLIILVADPKKSVQWVGTHKICTTTFWNHLFLWPIFYRSSETPLNWVPQPPNSNWIHVTSGPLEFIENKII